MQKWFAVMALLVSGMVSATEIGGVKVDDAAKVSGQDLTLVGGGVRAKWGFARVYVGALYTAEKPSNADSVIYDNAHPRRVTLSMLRHVDGEKFQSSLSDGLEANAGDNEMQNLQGSIHEMAALFEKIHEVNEGDVITLDFIPGRGTLIAVHGSSTFVPGDAFARAMLRIWLGKNPVSSSLKWQMLGNK